MTDRRLALVVAVDRYDHPKLQQLAAPAADAEALAGVLGDPGLGGFEVDVLANATSWVTAQRVERLLADRHPTDLVLLHFSGHGLKDDAGELYLAATDTQPDLLGSTAVDAAWINRVMQRSRAQRVVLLLDCCYGGAFERGLIARAGGDVDVGDQFRQRDLGGGRGRVVITASTAMEYAFEGAQLSRGAAATPSVFTSALVEGIRTGDADRDQDGHVALGELYDYVFDQVRARSPQQTPSKWEFGLRGDLYVARNPHRRVRAATLAPELIDLVRHPMPAVRLTAVRELARIARGDDPARAAAARNELQALADDDSRSVSAEAAAVLAETQIQPDEDVIDLGEPPPPAVPTRPPTPSRSVRGKGALLLLAAAAVVVATAVPVIVSFLDRDKPNGGNATAAYDTLLGSIPATMRTTCSEQPSDEGLAKAKCKSPTEAYPTYFEHFAAGAALAAQKASAETGSCAKAPPASRTFGNDLVEPGFTGWLGCRTDKTSYTVRWGLTDRLITCTVVGRNYTKTYSEAIAVLQQMP